MASEVVFSLYVCVCVLFNLFKLSINHNKNASLFYSYFQLWFLRVTFAKCFHAAFVTVKYKLILYANKKSP